MKLVREYIIFEKFHEDDLDPVSDLGIGLYKFWEQKHEEIGKTRVISTFEKYFEKDYRFNSNDGLSVHKLYEMLYYLQNKLNPQEAFNKIVESLHEILKSKREINDIQKELIRVLKKHFYVDVKPYIYEKLEQDSDPIKDLKIGLRYDLDKICYDILY